MPFVSYFIFPAVLAEGAIQIPRPIGAPFITTGGDDPEDAAAVGVASVSADGIWTRAPRRRPIDSPAGINVPYGPDTVDGLVGATAENTNGTDIAIDADGRQARGLGRPRRHLVRQGDRRRSRAARRRSRTGRRRSHTPARSGGPSVTVDDDGKPWVAYAIDSPAARRSRSRPTDGTKWTARRRPPTIEGASAAATPARRRSRSTPTARSCLRRRREPTR